jgi:Protein of unknown function (DUF1573)
MKNLLFFFALIVFTTKGYAQPSSVGNIDPNAPVMVFKNDTMKFGTITQGTSVTREFVFTNTGKTPLVITDATAPCGCTVPEWPKEPIMPGKSAVIKVTFNSTGKMGPQDKMITISSNSRDGSVFIHLIGTVVAAPAAGTPTPATGPAPAPAPKQ